jgi:SAM-dependent methyltransferase
MMRFLDLANRLAPALGRATTRVWYQYMTRLDRAAEMVFMNYGFAELDGAGPLLSLEPDDERDRYCIQLYHHVAAAVPLDGRDVLEVGCGRGGGAAYIARYLGPRSMTGVDIARAAVGFCAGHHRCDRLAFRHADAEALPFADASFDAVVNVESAHCYPSMKRFLGEVYRCLRPGGYFLFADRCDRRHSERLRGQLRRARFSVVEERNITPNILRALDLDERRKVELIDRGVPWLFRKAFKQFAATEGTSLRLAFESGHWEYLSFVLRKPARRPAVNSPVK